MLQAISRSAALAALWLLAFTMGVRADDWQPVLAEELQMKREPKAPNAAAINLYRQVDRNDNDSEESVYLRIKILTEEGRKHANVEIPYLRGSSGVRALRARVLQPDGRIAEFDGTVYDKPLLKARGVKMMAKSFTLPNVTIGSIIEYRYRRTLPRGWVFDSRWILSDDLFTRHARFSLRPAYGLVLRWSWPLGLPTGTAAPAEERGVIRLETRDVPAFVSEEHMPPEDVMKFRVEFVYDSPESGQKEPEAYWKAFSKRYSRSLQNFVSADRPLEQEVARLVQPEDSAETKARKLYARALQVRNLSFERETTEQESKREKLEEIHSAKDVLKHGYASADAITWFLYGLLRAAKLDANLVLVSTRDDHFFDPQMMNAGQLNTCVIFLVLGNKGVFLDPGTPYMPFAFLPWSETAVKGLRLGRQDVEWVTTSLPRATESRVERKVAVKLSPAGTLEGKATVTYTGLEAAWRRLNQRHEDDTERRKYLEDDLKHDVPVGIDVKLVNVPDWTSAETDLVAEFEFRVQGWATSAGSRALVPVGVFSGAEKRSFEHSARVHPVYFSFPYRHVDEVRVELPPGWQISSVPEARTNNVHIATYNSSARADGGELTMRREFEMNTILIQQKHYPQLRDFYQAVRAGDEDQVVITRGAAQ